MKIKKILALTMAAGMLFMATAGAKTMEFTIGDTTLYVSDENILKSELDAPAYIENGRTMVPVRVVSEEFGAYVSWDGGKREVSIIGDGNEIKFSIDADKAYVNGNLVSLDAPATIKNGRTMVPLRFVSEALGRSVEYIDLTKQILISDEKPVLEIGDVKIYKDDIRVMKDFYLPNTGMDEKVYTRLLLDYITEISVMSAEAEKNGASLKDEEKESIKASCEQFAEEIYTSTLTSSAVKMLSLNTVAANYINNYDFGISEEEIKKEYKDNYICAKHILVLTTNPETREPLSLEERNKASEKAAYALRKLKAGVSFDEVMLEFGQDPGVEYNKDGYVFTKGEMIEDFENAAFSLRIGEMTGIVQSELGYHIIKRVELPEMTQDIYKGFYNQKAQSKYEEVLDGCIKNTTVKENFTVEEIVEALK